MGPTIKCDRFTITLTDKREVIIELEYGKGWWVKYDGGAAGEVSQMFDELEGAVFHARKLAEGN